MGMSGGAITPGHRPHPACCGIATYTDLHDVVARDAVTGGHAHHRTSQSKGADPSDWRQLGAKFPNLATECQAALTRIGDLFAGLNPMGNPWTILVTWVIDRLGMAKALGSLIQSLYKRFDLLSELSWTLMLKLLQVVQLPTDAWKLSEMRDSQQAPLRMASDQ